MIEQELRCRHCKRYLGKAFGSVVAELLCSNSSCKGTTQVKVLQADQTKDMSFKFATKEIEPKPMKKEVEVS